ncbi:tetratricopeptide repeat protein [Yinghuangia seranimata]|uniref:tetratricopeptide repeat protein n=1 Tax=Yinghuangia seranimata TaxID=408067 RepID=UPI00248B406D|nr:tetratricopeptide repeat protein [Yinghuangia seranimata]MDI2127913.1 tetratricopeptide repeat protein [Yinghuangia seranimata]
MRNLRRVRLAAASVVAAGVLIGVPVLVARHGDGGSPARAAAVPLAAPDATSGRGSLEAVIAAAQARLRTRPDDADTLAALGTAYVEQARSTGDPAYYPRAEEALTRALAHAPQGSAAYAPALVGMAALANARHDFGAARGFADRAAQAAPYNAAVYGTLGDALTQLGAAHEATAAIQRMLDLRPSVASFTRASYDLELRGATDDARTALERALEIAATPDETAYCRRYLGELARRAGDPGGALAHFDAGLAAAPGNPALRAGRAAALAALGRRDEALTEYAAATAALPLPQFLVEYGELLDAAGRPDAARAQFDLVAASFRLLEANGASDDLARAQFEADHGDPAEALRRAQAEWGRRQAVFVADALAWALHRNGRDAEALTYAERAVAGGWHDPLPLGHLRDIKAALAASGSGGAA